MLRSLILPLAFSGLIMTATPCLAQRIAPAKSAEPPAKYSLNILELTNSEIYRYAREMFLRGNDHEAAKAFLRILSMDCTNRVAQYHLRQIADRSPDLAFLNDKLNRLFCRPYDFKNEDFLPASIYYEKDAQILFDQLVSRQRRYRLSEKDLNARIEDYARVVRELEAIIIDAKAGKPVPDTLPALTPSPEEAIRRIESGRELAARVQQEIKVLMNQLASERLDRQKDVQDLRTGVAEAEMQLNRPEVKAQNEPALQQSIAQAKQELDRRERELADKDLTIKALENRFNDIQQRLQAVQTALAARNAEVRTMVNTNSSTQP